MKTHKDTLELARRNWEAIKVAEIVARKAPIPAPVITYSGDLTVKVVKFADAV